MEETVNIPDLSFINICNEKYGINRGVYNTIDAWFYNQGIHQIIKRRETILSFLEYIKEKYITDNRRCKFGHGGLTEKLEEYYFSNIQEGLPKRTLVC
jgi:riboflavin kinase